MNHIPALLALIDNVNILISDPRVASVASGAAIIYNKMQENQDYSMQHEAEKRKLRTKLEDVKNILENKDQVQQLRPSTIDELSSLVKKAEDYFKKDGTQRFKWARYHIPFFSPINEVKIINLSLQTEINIITGAQRIGNQDNQQANSDIKKQLELMETIARESHEIAIKALTESTETKEALEKALDILYQTHNLKKSTIRKNNDSSNIMEFEKKSASESDEDMPVDEGDQVFEEDPKPKKKLKTEAKDTEDKMVDPFYKDLVDLGKTLTEKALGHYEFIFEDKFIIRKTPGKFTASHKRLEVLLKEMVAGMKDETIDHLVIDLSCDVIKHEKIKVLCRFLNEKVICDNLMYLELNLSCKNSLGFVMIQEFESLMEAVFRADKISYLNLVLSGHAILNNVNSYQLIERIHRTLPILNHLSVDLQSCRVDEMLKAVLNKYLSSAGVDKYDMIVLEGNDYKLQMALFEDEIKEEREAIFGPDPSCSEPFDTDYHDDNYNEPYHDKLKIRYTKLNEIFLELKF